ncbi:monooxygenase FAD-binding protein [Cubamyces sp. BRFM 1775]|nr:monooxygenase FAD-binding protein [Cubamyces sp. BRFM 1775]
MSSTPRIAIIGGGPSGLVLLVTLFKRGIPATLYEREASRDSRAHLGGMLDLIWESGQRAFRDNGLEDEFIKHSRAGDAEEMRIAGKDGVPLFVRKKDAPEGNNLKDSRPEIDRKVIRDILLDAVPAESVKWDHAFVSARPLGDGQHEVTFANGVVITADILVGADGANSRVRTLLSSATPIYFGIHGAEVSLPAEIVALPENKDISDAAGQGTLFACQDSKTFCAQRNGSGRIRAYAWHSDTIDWTLPSDPKEAKKVLLDIYHDWAPWVRKFIELADEKAIYLRPLTHLPPDHNWPHAPGVTLIGDAAHLTVISGEGANWAMLDGLELGLVLADAISKGLDKAAREAAIAEWEQKMLARVRPRAELIIGSFKEWVGPDAPQSMVNAMKRYIAEAKGQ